MMDSNINHFDIRLHKQVSETHIRTLNKFFSTLKTYGEGLELLKLMLNYCPENFLNENVNWLDYCLVKHSEHLNEVKLHVIEKFVEASVSNHELSKKIASEYLSKILEFCLAEKRNNNELIASFNVLIVCMKRYNWFSNHKVKIEEHILSFFESSDCINKKASIAFLYLQQVGNAGTDGINHKNNFKISVEKLCSTVHDLFDTLMENRIEIDHIDRPIQEGFSFEVLLYDTNKMLELTATRIINVITFLMTMVQKDFITCKEIAPYQILNIIRRGTIIHKCVSISHENSLEDYQFCFLLNNIQVKLLHLLRVLILWLQNNIYCFSFFVSNILIDCLKRSQNCKCFSVNSVYHETIYIVLKSWLVTVKSGLNSHFQTELVTCILKDITPIRSSVTLNIKQGISKKRGVKRKISQNVVLTNQQDSNMICKSKYDLEKEEVQCQLALETLSTLFSSNILKVDKKIIREVYILTMEIFNKINISAIPHPYKSFKSQLKLQELLVSFYEQDTLKTFPFISLSLNILNTSTCGNTQMESINSGLNNLEKLCQPVSASLVTFSSSEPSNDQQIIDTNPQILSIDTQNTHTETQIRNTETEIMSTDAQMIGTDIVLMECVVDLTNYNRSEINNLEEINPVKNEINIIEDPVNKTIDGSILEQRTTLNSAVSTSISEPESSCISLNNIKDNDVSNVTNNFSDTEESTDILQQIGIHSSNETVKAHNEADDKQTNTITNISEKCTGDGIEEVNTNIKDAGFEELNSFVDELKDWNW